MGKSWKYPCKSSGFSISHSTTYPNWEAGLVISICGKVVSTRTKSFSGSEQFSIILQKFFASKFLAYTDDMPPRNYFWIISKCSRSVNSLKSALYIFKNASPARLLAVCERNSPVQTFRDKHIWTAQTHMLIGEHLRLNRCHGFLPRSCIVAGEILLSHGCFPFCQRWLLLLVNCLFTIFLLAIWFLQYSRSCSRMNTGSSPFV